MVLLFYFQILGLFSMKCSFDLKQWKFVFSKIISVFFVVTYGVLSLVWISIYFNYTVTLNGDQYNFITVTDVVRQNFLYLTSVIAVIMFSIRRQKSAEIINAIIQIRILSKSINDKSDYFIKAALSRSMQIFVIFALLKMISTGLRYKGTSDYSLLYQFVFEFYTLISNATLQQYTFLMLLLFELFKIANESLLEIEKKFENSEALSLLDSSLIVDKMHDIFKLYVNLYELSKKVSKFFSIVIFFCNVGLFTTLLIFSYNIVDLMISHNMKASSTTYIYFVITEALLIAHLLSVNWAADMIIDEVS